MPPDNAGGIARSFLCTAFLGELAMKCITCGDHVAMIDGRWGHFVPDSDTKELIPSATGYRGEHVARPADSCAVCGTAIVRAPFPDNVTGALWDHAEFLDPETHPRHLARPESHVRPAWFALDGSPDRFPGFHDPADRWNGWACPYFPPGTAEAVADYLGEPADIWPRDSRGRIGVGAGGFVWTVVDAPHERERA